MTKKCAMCGEFEVKVAANCGLCRAWWKYHFTDRKHGPNYFATKYIPLRERALKRASFAMHKTPKMVKTA